MELNQILERGVKLDRASQTAHKVGRTLWVVAITFSVMSLLDLLDNPEFWGNMMAAALMLSFFLMFCIYKWLGREYKKLAKRCDELEKTTGVRVDRRYNV